MKTPFQYIEGKEFDDKNEHHVKTVIKRNKRLEYFTKNKTTLEEANPKIEITATMECFKCGSKITDTDTLDVDDLDVEIRECFASFKCDCCGSKYEKVSIFKDDWLFKVPIQKKLAKR